MKSLVVIQGCRRGIGKALLEKFKTSLNPGKAHILALNRRHEDFSNASSDPMITYLPLDMIHLSTCIGTKDNLEAKTLLNWLSEHRSKGTFTGIRQIWNVAGILEPERSIVGTFCNPENPDKEAANWANASNSFHTNTLGPLRLISLLSPFLARSGDSFCCPLGVFYLSARVASMQENTLGGWYSYRASKTASNQLMRTLNVEFGRKSNKQDPIPCLSLHPGMVDTDMTRQFHRNIQGKLILTPEQCAEKLFTLSRDQAKISSIAGKFYDIQKEEFIPF